ncbi:MAG: HD domain-containing protein [Candidatus Niyogibacteria bacterium]|nr:HD domain-containing protein [Candidatus Niyogibacteria bacterium]
MKENRFFEHTQELDVEKLRNEAEELFLELKELPAVKRLLDRIDAGLKEKYPDCAKQFSEVLPYHGRHHTEDVMKESLFFALADKSISRHDMEILAVSAASHDSGFIKQYDANEPIGAGMLDEEMKSEGYSAEDIKKGKDAVLSTRVTFTPGFKQTIEGDDLVAKILADADVSNFGREDYFEKGDAVYQELVAIGKIPEDSPENRRKFDEFSLNMLKTHEWNTEVAKHLRNGQKEKNIEILEKKLSQG